jgi:hypothetical protein
VVPLWRHTTGQTRSVTTSPPTPQGAASPSRLRLLDNIVIQVAEEDPDEPELLGVYHGTALTETTPG